MTMVVQAVYMGGVLRPVQPLALAEGETVEITVATTGPAPTENSVPEEDLIRRLQASKNFREWLEITKLLPSDDDGYDVVKALDENRRWSGDRSLLPKNGVNP